MISMDATAYCLACNRPLRRAHKGLGPVCRSAYWPADLPPEAEEEAEGLVDWLSRDSGSIINTYGIDAYLGALNRLNELGLHRLFSTVAHRLATVEVQYTDLHLFRGEGRGRLSVATPFNDGWVWDARTVPGRWWEAAKKVWTFPTTSRVQVWAMLQRHFPNHLMLAPKGLLRIPPTDE